MDATGKGSVERAVPGRCEVNAGLQVLLVDDSPINCKACSALLALWGVEPVIACDGAQALKLVQERNFDMVLMDINMPIMDGLVATAEIRRFEQANPSRSNVPIVAYSSAEVSPAIIGKVGLSAALRKPCDAASMGECLRRWCGEKFRASQTRGV